MATRLLIGLCWVPVASLAGLMLYVRQFDGWGRWSAAPLLLLPVLASLAMTLWGVALVVAARRAAGPAGTARTATAVAALPLVWFGYRILVS